MIRKHVSSQFKTDAAQCFLGKQYIFFQKNNVYLKQKNNKDKSIGTITLFCEGFASDFGVFCPFIQQSTCEVRQWCWTRRPGPQSLFQKCWMGLRAWLCAVQYISSIFTTIIPHHPHCCYVYIPGTTYLHILMHCTLYLIAHLTPYFISLFVSYFILTIFVYIYTLSCFCFIVFIAFMLFLFYYHVLFFLSCTFHWADLSWLTFHYPLYPVWLCMWQIIKNLEPWTFFHTRLIQPCLYGLCFVHWGTVMLQKKMTCSHKVGSIAFSKKCWWSIRIPSLLQSPVVASFTPPHLMRGIVFGDVRLGSICSAMETHSMKLPPEFLCSY